MSSESSPRVGVLASGQGSNLQALIDAARSGALGAHVAIVVSSRPDAVALRRARLAGIPAVAMPFVARGSAERRRQYEETLLGVLLPLNLDLLVLAGWMLILSQDFLARCPFPVINVHPALLPDDRGDSVTAGSITLPALRGMHAVADAVALGLPVTGVTVHRVTAEVDAGPVMAREVVPLHPADTEESLYARVKPVEHRLLVQAAAAILSEPAVQVAHQ